MATVTNLAGPNTLIFGALSTLFKKGDVFEIRIPNTLSQGTMSGYFDDIGLAARVALGMDGKAPGIYVTLNPVNPDIFARSANHLEGRCQNRTTDKDILCRRWLPIDFDPKRPAGISSTEEEHAAAMSKAEEVKTWLSEIGWPDPLVADSGNGAHLLYRIDLPNDAAATSAIQNILLMLSSIFSDDMVHVDETVYNAARIWKLYGTMSRKGDDIPARPHRRSMMTVPPPEEIVTQDQIFALASEWKPNPSASLKTVNGPIMDLGEWAEGLGLKVVYGPADLFNGKGKKWVLDRCPFNEDHQKPMIGVIQGRPIFKCLHQSCQEYGWDEFRGKVDTSYSDLTTLENRIVEAYQEDRAAIYSDDILDGLARLSEAKYQSLRNQLRDRRITGLKELDARVRNLRAQIRAETDGTKGVPNNIYGLSQDIQDLQSIGAVPSIWYNVLSDKIVTKEADWEVSPFNMDAAPVAIMMEFHKRGIKWVKKSHVVDAVMYIATEHPYNPLEEKFNRLIWDRQPRLDTWLPSYLGTKDDEYTRAVGRKWMISAVARGMSPGCQADHMLILEGAQGIGKSKTLRTLGGEYHVEYAGGLANDTDHRNMVHVMIGKNIIEISELSAFKGSSIERLKNMLTTTVDDVRLAYRHDATRHKRACVFAGTTNEVRGTYIFDTTGARRFWPIVCGAIDVPRLQQDRDQLWAEAVNAYKHGEDWWTVPASTAAEQEQRAMVVEDDFLFQKILTNVISEDSIVQGVTSFITIWRDGRPIKDRSGITIQINNVSIAVEIWDSVATHDTRRQNRVYMILKRMGFSKKIVKTEDKKFAWAYDANECSSRLAYDAINDFINRKWERQQRLTERKENDRTT